MGRIRLANIKVYAYHGCLFEEGQIGSEYLVNLEVTADLSKPSISDHLKDTVDYVGLNKIVKEEMAIRSKLLEHVAKRIIDRVLETFNQVNLVDVSVSKINPPLGGNVAEVVVSIQTKRKN